MATREDPAAAADRGISFRLGRADGRMGAVPSELYVELTDACNADCPACDYARSAPRAPRRLLPRPLLDLLVDELDGTDVEVFFMSGEPLLHPRLDELTGRLRASGWRGRLHLTSNGQLYQRRDLAWHRFDSITFSIDGLGEVATRARSLTDHEAHVAAAAADLLARRERPQVVINSVIRPESVPGLAAFCRTWLDRGVDAVQLIHLQGTTPEAADATRRRYPALDAVPHNLHRRHLAAMDVAALRRSLAQVRALADPRIHLSPDLDEDEIATFYHRPERWVGGRRRCGKPWTSLELDVTGQLHLSSICVRLPLGPLAPGALAAAWAHPRLQRFRRLIDREERIPACQRCCSYFEGWRVA
ncbi:MAG TPA: radical SAM protein [Thermoanaerobaculia bacterium]|nr:radical SAM protein [Thermoanaerobaculia bacterium]